MDNNSSYYASDPIIPFPPTNLVVTLNSIPISTKLHQTNFLTWKSQILPIVNGYNLAQFFNSCSPSPTILNTTGQISLNPEYLPWNRQDQLLLGWLRSSLTEAIQAQVLSCTTSASLWIALESMFAFTSRARMLDLKRQLQTAAKGSPSCTDFLLSIRWVADELAFVGAPVFDDDITMAVLNGLGPKFNSFVAAITATDRRDPLNFTDIHGLLLSHEALLRHQLSTMVPSSTLYSISFCGISTNSWRAFQFTLQEQIKKPVLHSFSPSTTFFFLFLVSTSQSSPIQSSWVSALTTPFNCSIKCLLCSFQQSLALTDLQETGSLCQNLSLEV